MIEFLGYDIAFAIEIRRIFMEPHNNQERDTLIFRPTRQFLGRIARLNPPYLTCAASSVYSLPQEFFPGTARNLYLISPDKRVAYLGMVFDKEASQIYRRFQIRKAIKKDPQKAQKLKTSKLIRPHYAVVLLTSDSNLTFPALELAAKNFLERFSPSLANTPIMWLADEESNLLDRRIYQEADATLQHFPESEYHRRIAEDQ